MIDRCYLEITNICNLDCVFCPKNHRTKRRMTLEEFDLLTTKLSGQIKFLYFHLMGEPMLHPQLSEFIAMARAKGFIPVLTTNGTLLDKPLDTLPHKIQISLHSQEGNDERVLEHQTTAKTEATAKSEPTAKTASAALCEATTLIQATAADREAAYIDKVMRFSFDAARRGTIVVLRLWNQGGFDSRNDAIHQLIARHIPQSQWTQRYDGWKLDERIYLEYDQMFEWPDEEHSECGADEVFCYALRNQIGVHVDGTVVPCCLDHDGSVKLGNLFEQSLSEILSSPRATALYEGFSRHRASEELCRKCDYAAVTKRFRKPSA